MDKVQLVLGYLRKYHFWLLCVVAVLAGLFGWMKARSKLSAEYLSNKSTITGKFTALEGIQNEPNPPNDSWTKAISTLTEQEQKEVGTAWQAVYEAQQKVLEWPDVMPQDFKAWIRANPDKDIPGQWISIYQTEVIKTEFPKLATIVDAAPEGAQHDVPLAEGETPRQYKVIWNDQDKIRKMLEMSGSRATPFEIRLKQEDLWVIQALLSIIAITNKDSLYSSRVKRIEELEIGAATAAKFEDGMKPGHIEFKAPSAGEGGAMPPQMDMLGEGAQAPAPDDKRYVDADGKPEPSGTWKQHQFKRMPVHLRLVMDQREITRLLAACANYPLPVEVRQLRINPGKDGEGPQRKRDEPMGAVEPTATAAEAYDVTVEINGIIYIFNPPDPTKLGVEPGGMQAAG